MAALHRAAIIPFVFDSESRREDARAREGLMTTARFGFVGPMHGVSPWLLAALAKVGTLEAICGDATERDSARFHARWTFPDLATLLRESEPTGVVISQPLTVRPRMIKECLTAGAAVLVIGPPSRASACNRLGLFAKLSGRAILAASVPRFAPAIMLAKRLLDSGKVGVPISLSVHCTHRGAPRHGPEDDGPVPADQLFEGVDLVHFLLGPLAQVSAVAHNDGVLAAIGTTLSSVAVSLVFHASGAAETVGLELEIRGADGTFLHVDRDARLLCANGSRVDGAHRTTLAAADPATELGFDGLAAEFRRLATSGRSAAGLIGPVGPVVAATEALLTSAAKNRPVAVKASLDRPEKTSDAYRTVEI
jgi:predicted dehydrogenase